MVNDILYVAGGYLGTGKRSDLIEKYNAGVDEWEVLGLKLTNPIEAFSLLIDESSSKFYIIGGKTELGDRDDIIEYNFEKGMESINCKIKEAGKLDAPRCLMKTA